MKYLNNKRPIYGLQSPAYSMDISEFRTVEDVANEFLRQIKRVQPHGPYHMLGWSFGGYVAHEIAALLECEGETVKMLGLMDTYPTDGMLKRFNQAQSGQQGHVKNADLKLNERQKALVRRDFDPSRASLAQLEASFVEKLLNVTEHNVALLHNHVPKIIQSGITVFRAEWEGPGGSVSRWRKFVLGDINEYDMPCRHGHMDKPEIMAKIAAIINTEIDE
jgi:thioesterase domain-containing protein